VTRLIERILGGLLAAALFLRGVKGHPRPRQEERAPAEGTIEREVGSHPRAERAAIGCMFVSSLSGLAFPVLYLLDPDTQWLGLSFGLALAFAATGAVIAGKAVVPREQAVEERAELDHPADDDRVVEDLARAGEGVSRRGLLIAAAGAAGVGISAAAVVPAASLGPNVGNRIDETPWAPGRYLVNEQNERIKAAEIAVGQMVTAFPEGADKEDLGSPVAVVRLLERQFHMTPAQMHGVVHGLVAYSKVCTHAACAVSMFRYPLSQGTTDRKPALVCPCHYSTFDPARGAKVVFGPAGRPLPQLPLRLDAQGFLVAGGDYSGSPGPAWWSARR
jgi:ubiquinol-cytochrome c reductase iron-sulfur subunit